LTQIRSARFISRLLRGVLFFNVIDFLFHFMTKLSGSRVHLHAALLLLSILLSGCITDNRHRMVVSVADQKMIVLRDGKPISDYPVSTSKFGVGDTPGSYATPLGVLRVKEKIGHGLALGTVFKSRQPTGEVLPINAPGRDPIVTRILWLEGLDDKNRNAYRRYIYIHGTPEERNIGRPVSYGCIRMKSKDVIELFDTVGLNSKLLITPNPLPPTLTMAVPQRNTRNLSPSR
jgi:hypothetical protein